MPATGEAERARGLSSAEAAERRLGVGSGAAAAVPGAGRARALGVFHADAALFRTGWFVELLVTQTLVIFVIRTADRPWRSRPSAGLGWGVGGSALAGMALPYSPLGPWPGLVPQPGGFFLFLLGMVAGYLVLVEVVKRWFYRRWPM
jgi:Mg2+-importing ATPase